MSEVDSQTTARACMYCNTKWEEKPVKRDRERILLIVPLHRLRPRALEEIHTRHLCWQQWRAGHQPHHWRLSLLAIACVIPLAFVLFRSSPWMRITLLGAWGFILSLPAYKFDVARDFHAHFDPTTPVLDDTASSAPSMIMWLIFAFMIYVVWKKRRELPNLIMHEEVIFREGAESWTPVKRIRMAAYFGFAHLANWIYPISTCIMIAIAGFIVGEIYRKNVQSMGRERAMSDAAILHLTYDIIAIGVFLVGFTLITIATFF